MRFTPVLEQQCRSTVIAAVATVAETTSSAPTLLLPRDFFGRGTRSSGANSLWYVVVIVFIFISDPHDCILMLLIDLDFGACCGC